MSDPIAIPAESDSPAAQRIEDELPWLRLDPRMLFVTSARTLLQFFPLVLIWSVFGGFDRVHVLVTLAAVVLSIAMAAATYFTTSYRIGPVHVELRRGLFERNELRVPRARIRSVDVRATALHRLFGLAVVHLNTGQQSISDSGGFELDGLPARAVPAVRAALVEGVAASPDDPAAQEDSRPVPESSDLARWRWSWMRFAPFSFTGFAVLAAIVGVTFQYADDLHLSVDTDRLIDDAGARVGGSWIAIALFVVAVLIAAVAAASLVAIGSYVAVYGGFTLNDAGPVLEVRHGLLTSRQTTLDRSRFRGLTLHQPLLLRFAGGARLSAIMTGIKADASSQKASALLLPQAPRADTLRVAADVLGSDRPLTIPLTPHGPVATRRRWTRAVVPPAVLGLAVIAVVPTRPWWAWLLLALVLGAACAVAADRARGLGHAVMPGVLITQSGSFARNRDALATSGIVGWRVRQSWFQRRAGVATVIAASAAGAPGYRVIDLPAEQVADLIEAATPGAASIWLPRR